MLHLPDVTLIQIGEGEGADEAETRCTEQIKFGDTVRIPPLPTYEEYNKFVVLDLYNYFKTKHCLLIQHDGFIVSPWAWRGEFTEYDYVGAVWYPLEPYSSETIHKQGIVGNGGFSLRSKRFCETSSLIGGAKLLADPSYTFSPEDQIMLAGPGWDSRVETDFRLQLELKGINIAPVDVACEFSWELHPNDPQYRGQFGIHGWHTIERLKALRMIF